MGLTVVGVDEAGRGALAGPVVAGAVVFEPSFRGLACEAGKPPQALDGVRDSKLTGPAERPHLAQQICFAALAWAVGEASASEIDALGIARAGELAMIRAINGLGRRVDIVLVDGFRIRTLRGVEQHAIVRGDRTVFSIAAASLVAKVHRDSALVRLASSRSEYGFDRHKGYGSPEHLRAIALHGPAVEHRLSWAPLRGHVGTAGDSAFRRFEVGPGSDAPPLPVDVGPAGEAPFRSIEVGSGSDSSHRQLELPSASVPARPTAPRTSVSIPRAASAALQA